jgi:hypothetical protein
MIKAQCYPACGPNAALPMPPYPPVWVTPAATTTTTTAQPAKQ